MMTAFDPVTGIFNVVGKVLDKVWPDQEKKAEVAFKLAELQQSGELAKYLQGDIALLMGQIETNKLEIQHGGLFKGGWRPWIGWTCGIALTYHFIVRDFIVSNVLIISYYRGAVDEAGEPIPPFPIELLPNLDMYSLMAIVTGMLGLGIMRSRDKHKTMGTVQ